MKTSEQINELAAALAKAQSVIDNVEKNRKAYGYQYADLGQCLEAIRQPLSTNGLSFVQPISEKDGKNYVITRLMHTSGQWIESEISFDIPELKQGNNLQKLGAAITYVRRYALCAMVGLAQEDDNASAISKAQDKANSVEKLNNDADLVQTLIAKCKENNVENDFYKKFNITKNNIESVKNAVRNFDALLAEYKAGQVQGVENAA